MDQYKELTEKRCSDSDAALVKKFISKILKKIKEISVEKAAIVSVGFTETDIKLVNSIIMGIITLKSIIFFRSLIHNCLLTVRTTTTYWFGFPGAGEFMKVYAKGRQNIIRLVRKSKYQQILQNVGDSCLNANYNFGLRFWINILDYSTWKDLERRDMRKTVKLGVHYHIHDIVGADVVTW